MNTFTVKGRVPPHRRNPLRRMVCWVRRGHRYRCWISPYQFADGPLRRMCRCFFCGDEREEEVPA